MTVQGSQLRDCLESQRRLRTLHSFKKCVRVWRDSSSVKSILISRTSRVAHNHW